MDIHFYPNEDVLYYVRDDRTITLAAKVVIFADFELLQLILQQNFYLLTDFYNFCFQYIFTFASG